MCEGEQVIDVLVVWAVHNFLTYGREQVGGLLVVWTVDVVAKYEHDRVHQFEENERQKAARDEEEGDSDDDAEALEFRRLEAGAYTQQRLAVVMVVIAAHSSAVARRINEKLHQVCLFDSGRPHFDALLCTKWPLG